MKNLIEEKRQEEYLFKIARRVLDWGGVKISRCAGKTGITEEEISNLVMMELVNIKK